jgi:hypothetical protein
MAKPYDEGLQVWHDAVAWLLAGGRTTLEALDGANLILEAWKRQRDEERGRSVEPGGGEGEGDSPEEDSGAQVWHDAVASLLADRRSPTEAFVGANLVREGWERHRDEDAQKGGGKAGGGSHGSANGSSVT